MPGSIKQSTVTGARDICFAPLVIPCNGKTREHSLWKTPNLCFGGYLRSLFIVFMQIYSENYKTAKNEPSDFWSEKAQNVVMPVMKERQSSF